MEEFFNRVIIKAKIIEEPPVVVFKTKSTMVWKTGEYTITVIRKDVEQVYDFEEKTHDDIAAKPFKSKVIFVDDSDDVFLWALAKEAKTIGPSYWKPIKTNEDFRASATAATPSSYTFSKKVIHMMRELCMTSEVEHGAYLKFDPETGMISDDVDVVRGESNNVTIPIQAAPHFHTHPYHLLKKPFNIAAQPPSRHDVSVTCGLACMLETTHPRVVMVWNGLYVMKANHEKLAQLGVVDEESFHSIWLKFRTQTIKVGRREYTTEYYDGLGGAIDAPQQRILKYAQDNAFERKRIAVWDAYVAENNGKEPADDNPVLWDLPPFDDDVVANFAENEKKYFEACAKVGVDIYLLPWDDIKDEDSITIEAPLSRVDQASAS